MSRSLLPAISRRDWLRLSALGVLSSPVAHWLPALAEQTATNPARKRSCILLWMTGGPSQIDTFDLKPEHENGGPVKPIETSVSGISLSEYLPQLAKQTDRLAIVRSMQTKEGDHDRATFLARTGYLSQGPINYPAMGSSFSKELKSESLAIPAYISINPYRFLSPGAYGPGFLGPQFAPLVVGNQVGFNPNQQYSDENFKVKNLALPEGVTGEQETARLELLSQMENSFAQQRPGVSTTSHKAAYEKAVQMMHSETSRAFNLDEEPDELRDAYGRNDFGQGCLLARRLVEQGVPFVEVSLNRAQGVNTLGWDTHANNFDSVKSLCEVLDPAWSTLMNDLQQRGLLDSTLIVWMGEFGRTPKINQAKGRDHFPNAWSTVLAGGGIKGGQVVGRTSNDGMSVEDRPVSIPDFIATISKALGVDPGTQNISNLGRPIRIADPEALPIDEVLQS